MTGPCAIVLALSIGCATPADPGYLEGRRALAAGAWQPAVDALTRFSGANCLGEEPNSRCKEVHADLADCLLKLGQPRKAYFALEVAKRLPPFDGGLNERVYQLERKAQDTFGSALARLPGEGALTVTFESQTTDRFRFRGAHFLLDLHPLPTEATPYAPETVILAVPATVVSAGEHELEIVGDYESAGQLPPGYRFIVRGDHEFRISPAARGEIRVRFSERSPNADPTDALSATFHDQGAGLQAKAAPE